MGVTTGIAWTDHTYNPWWGCARVSPGCVHCYAETFAKRTGHDVWGNGGERRFFGDKHWAEPVKWNADAEKAGIPALVFCASMADVFEDHPALPEQRERLFALIEETPHLIWQLLTKRPENVRGMVPETWLRYNMPPNVWLGTTVEDQQRADERIPILVEAPARTRFLSVEPMIEPITLRDRLTGIDWVICGGESGGGARLMEAAWAVALRTYCAAAGVPFFFKQTGTVLARSLGIAGKGEHLLDLPSSLRVREFPASAQKDTRS